MDWHPLLSTQSAVGRAAKVDQKTIGRILNKEHEPQIDKVAKIAKAFELELWQILTPDLEPNNPPLLAQQNEALKKLYANLNSARDAISGVLKP